MGLVGHVGCSSDSGTESSVDASTDRGIILPPDAQAPLCDLTKPFGEPVFIPSANVPGGESGSFSSDELTFYSQNNTANGFHLYSATRPSRDCSFTPPTLLKNVNNTTGAGDYDPFITYDGLELFFSSDRQINDASTWFDLYYATRTSTDDDFSAPTPVPNLNTSLLDRAPALSADKKTLYFNSTGYGDSKGGIYKSARSGPNFGAARHIDLGTTTGDSSPIPSPDELTLYFFSERGGSVGSGDIWMATRPTKDADFGPPTNKGAVATLNTTASEGPRSISPDGCRMYLVTDRPTPNNAGTGKYNMWVATRPN